MKLADKPVYPYKIGHDVLNGGDEFEGGITFREALILSLAGNSTFFTESPVTIAMNIIYQADEIIKAMEDQ